MIKKQIKYRFGAKIRTIRERKGLTMKAVAEKAGVSESLISQIERNLVSPSVDTLLTVSDVLDIDYEFLFADYRKGQKVEIVRSNNRNRILLDNSILYQLTAINDSPDEHDIEAFLLEILPGKEKGSSEYGHTGKEFGLILNGTGRLIYGTEAYDLTAGDSVSFPSDIPHILKNTGESPLEAVWVITPPRIIFPKSNQ